MARSSIARANRSNRYCESTGPGLASGWYCTEKMGLPFLGEIPLDIDVRLSGDSGTPIAAGDGPVAQAYAKLAEGLVKRGFNLVSGGTDNHLMLVDLSGTEITGKVAEAALEEAGITVNKNAVPFDTRSPFVTSGLRLGTAACTTRGFDQEAFAEDI